jgi:hypothetical protein
VSFLLAPPVGSVHPRFIYILIHGAIIKKKKKPSGHLILLLSKPHLPILDTDIIDNNILLELFTKVKSVLILTLVSEPSALVFYPSILELLGCGLSNLKKT